MANYDSILQKFFSVTDSSYVITDTAWKILYTSDSLQIDDDQWSRWTRMNYDESVDGLDMEWEIADKNNGLYYKIRSKMVEDEGENYIVHRLIDVSDYANIFQDLSSYSRMWRTMTMCQRDLMNILTDKITGCLPVVVKHLQSECAVLFIRRSQGITRYVFAQGYERPLKKTISDMDFDGFVDDHTEGKEYTIPDFHGEFMCFARGSIVSGEAYALFVNIPQDDHADRMYKMYFNMFKMYLENALLREKIVYASEHDHLTGLYNKAKYSQLMSSRFRTCEHITVFNLDVNYLKRINDTLGHEAGNTLLRMAGKSLEAVSNDDSIFAFRMGGDEFMMIACEADEAAAKTIEAKWREALARINEEQNDIECVIACGIKTGTAPYDIDAILEEADRLMYADKRAIKISRGDDPDAR